MPPRQAEESGYIMNSSLSPPVPSSLLTNNDNDNDTNDLHEPLLLNGNGNANDDDTSEIGIDNDDENDNDNDNNDIDNEKNITIQFQCCKKKIIKKSVNHNVFLNLTLSVLYGISNSLWSGTGTYV